MKCSYCDKKAVYHARYEGKYYCKDHFIKWVRKRVRRTIIRDDLLGKEEKILISVSGGKDSLVLADILSSIGRKLLKWEIEAAYVIEGIKGFRDRVPRELKEFLDERDIPLNVYTFKEEIGLTLDEIVKRGEERGLTYPPCTYCGVFRRWIINRKAREEGFTAIATAHNLDDMVQTFLMNVIKGDLGRIPRQGPVSGVSDVPGFVKRVKPLYRIPEKEITVYALLLGYHPGYSACPYAERGLRYSLRHYINLLEEEHPGIKYSMLSSLLRLIPILSKEFPAKGGRCVYCGEPTTGNVCRACQLKKELGLPLKHL